MPLEPATVRRIAKLARIRLTDDEVPKLQTELNAILGYVEQLDAVDVDGVEPLSGGMRMALRLREDVLSDGGKRDAVLANAPARMGDFFTVPKVVE